jgi:ribonuclease HI
MSYFDDCVEPGLTRGLPYAGSYNYKQKTNREEMPKMAEKTVKYIIYADGASSNNQHKEKRIGAWASSIFTPRNGVTYKKSMSAKVDGATNNQMELLGVLESIKTVVSIDPTIKPEVEIRSDSRYVITGITEWLPDWKARGWKTKGKQEIKNKEMWQELDKLLPKITYSFEKVTAHDGNEHNEDCDKRAKQLCGSKIR